MLNNNMEKLSPLLLVFLLIGSIIGIGLSYATTNPQLNELKNQLEDQNSMISNIEKEKEIDKNKISEMEREIIVLNDEISNNKIPSLYSFNKALNSGYLNGSCFFSYSIKFASIPSSLEVCIVVCCLSVWLCV